MSNESIGNEENKPDTDLTPDQMERVNRYIESGLPGVSSIDDPTTFRMLDLYLSGKSYTQISRMCNVGKDIIMYLSYKTKWYKYRQEYFVELQNDLQNRLLETQLISQNFLQELVLFWHKKIGLTVHKFLTTGDQKTANDINMKDIAQYLKTIEVLQKMIQNNKENSEDGEDVFGTRISSLGMNVSEKPASSKNIKSEGSESAPKTKTINSLLSKIATLKREDQEKQSEKNNKNSEKNE